MTQALAAMPVNNSQYRLATLLLFKIFSISATFLAIIGDSLNPMLLYVESIKLIPVLSSHSNY